MQRVLKSKPPSTRRPGSYLPACPPNPLGGRPIRHEGPIQSLILTSDVLPISQLYDISESIEGQKVSQLQGAGQATFGGASRPGCALKPIPWSWLIMASVWKRFRTCSRTGEFQHTHGKRREWEHPVDFLDKKTNCSTRTTIAGSSSVMPMAPPCGWEMSQKCEMLSRIFVRTGL